MGEVTPIGNRRERRHWDRYVAEAREVYSDIVLREHGTDGEDDPGDLIRVYVPSADKINELNQAEAQNDLWQQVAIFLGDDMPRFREIAGGAPATALTKLLSDVADDLGLSASPGNAPASSA